MGRLDDVCRFYDLLERLERRTGGKRLLGDCTGRVEWPRRGVYFFFEPDEHRSHSGAGPRIVRVGTHALKEGSQTTLWNRLSQHKGSGRSGGGNHRGSIFRLLVGNAMKQRDQIEGIPSWGSKSELRKAAIQAGATREALRESELPLELAVSAYIRSMPFLWLNVDDEPGPGSDRGLIERSSIALLSNFEKAQLDPYSENWLGLGCDRERVRMSGLWNNNHVDEDYDPGFLERLVWHVERTFDNK